MKCIYCQNSPWSWQGKGEIKTVNDLAEIMRTLAIEDKVENWNLVSPTPYLPHIRQAASILRKEGIRLPFVWNSSGYERVETLEEYSDLCDFALFDLRYATNSTSLAASAAPNYPSYARNAIKWAYNRAPEKTIVRILVLPGLADEAIDSLKFLATEVSQEIAVSIMSQYTPAFLAKDKPPFDRKVLESEYDKVVSAAADLGFENGWTQGFESSSEVLDYLGENMTPGHGEIS
jgi:putative pyruvate formate lyase activating enzyme